MAEKYFTPIDSPPIGIINNETLYPLPTRTAIVKGSDIPIIKSSPEIINPAPPQKMDRFDYIDSTGKPVTTFIERSEVERGNIPDDLKRYLTPQSLDEPLEQPLILDSTYNIPVQDENNIGGLFMIGLLFYFLIKD